MYIVEVSNSRYGGWSDYYIVKVDNAQTAIERVIEKEGKNLDQIYYAYSVDEDVARLSESVDVCDLPCRKTYSVNNDEWRDK